MTDVSDPSSNRSRLLLGNARRGFVGIIRGIDVVEGRSSLSSSELESQLIEMGFVEGARVEILHEGAIGRDPIAVRVSGITIALRRREAQAVVVVPVTAEAVAVI
ncbi:FeoA family protein [Roseiarcaceae bacterium H3SJ34-1]|uniref:FeoA family protein n=1 Tax=Terripilifer ovatus TaxID=3032367 RepID=UPI003AB95C9E|nr:FeoA family protein [Roseiarcaceae bacterium H3SJ34-1]